MGLAALSDPFNARQPVIAGDTILVLVTGLGYRCEVPGLNSPPTVTIGQITADMVSVADSPTRPGISIVTVRVPPAAPGGDHVPIQVITDGYAVQGNISNIAIVPSVTAGGFGFQPF